MSEPRKIEAAECVLCATEVFSRLSTIYRTVQLTGSQVLPSHQLFLVYSDSGCWTDSYALGMLSTTSGSDLLDARSWKKSSHPVFEQNPDAQAFSPGHNSFFKSSDGKHDWIIYHANPAAGQGCGEHRSPRAQPLTWKSDGSPNFGVPVGVGVEIPRPQ